MNSTVCCPRCGTKGAIPKEYIGKRIQCSHCKNQFTARAVKTGKQSKMKLSSKIMLALCWVAVAVGIVWMIWPEVRKSDFGRQAERQLASFVKGQKNNNRQNEQTDKQLFPVGNPIAQDNDQPPAEKQVVAAPDPDAVIETTVAKLVDAFKNPLAGQDKFGDKRVRITGFISSGTLFTNFLQDVEGKKGDDQTPKIFCFFTNAYRGNQTLEDIGRIKVTVEGTCVGYHYGGLLALKDCDLVSGWDDLRSKKQQQATQDQEAKVLAAEKLEQEIRASIAVSSPQTTKKHDIVEVIGTVQSISPQLSDGNVHITVIPDPAIEYINEVHCEFRHVYRPQLAKLRPGNHVVIRGKGGDAQFSFNGANLTNCVLMK